MKKYFLIVVILVLGLIASACSGNNATPTKTESEDSGNSVSTEDNGNEPKEITYWYPWGGESEETDNYRMDQYEKDNELTSINRVYAPPDGGISNGKLLAAISGSNPPDLVSTNDTYGAYSLAVQGALQPIDEYLAAAGFKEDDVLESFRSLMKYDGKTYLFPQDSVVNLLYYNKKMFEEVGLDPNNPPTTIEELDKYAEKLTKINDDKVERFGFIPWIDGGDSAFGWGWAFGATFFDEENNKVVLDDPKLIDTFNWYNKYAQKYNPEKIKSFTSGFGGAFSPDHPFFTGKVAMTMNGMWFTKALRDYAPDIDYGVVALPAPEGGRPNSSAFSTNVFMIPKGAKDPETAVKVALYTAAPEMNKKQVDDWRAVMVYKSDESNSKWEQEGDYIIELIKEISASPDSGTPALTPIASQISNELVLLRDNIIYNNKDPKPLLQELEKKLQKEADKFK